MRTIVLAAVLAAAVLGSAAVGLAAGQTSLPQGADISWPQCPSSRPAAAAFAVIGVNRGRPGTANPCLASELAWAAGLAGAPPQPPLAVYVNTADPGPAASDWPAAAAPGLPQPCDGTWSSGCAFDYGYRSGVYATSALSTAAAGAGLAQATVSGLQWWLDVETTNAWARSQANAAALNVAVLQGFVSGLGSVGVAPARIGIYSTSYQWKVITGLDAALSPLFFSPLQPNWLAGAGSAAQAQQWCAQPGGFSGGPVTLVQFPAGKFDGDVACGAAPVSAPPPPVAPAPPPVAPTPPPPPGSGLAAAGTAGSLAGAPVAALGGRAPVLSWGAGSFPAAAQLSLAPAGTASPPPGYGAPLVDLAILATATAPSAAGPAGTALSALAAPVDLRLPAPAATGATAVFASTDGVAWTALPVVPAAAAAPPGGGVVRNPDGSVDVVTASLGFVAVFPLLPPPPAPGVTSAALAGSSVTLSWSPPPAGPGSAAATAYRVLVDGAPVATVAPAAGRTVVRALRAHARTVLRLVPVDALGRSGSPSAPVVVAPLAPPAGLPSPIPDWAWRLLAWRQAHRSGAAGPRPATPSPLPSWWWRWARWRSSPFRILGPA